MIFPRRTLRALKEFAFAREGSSAVELALVLPFLIGFIIPLVDLGMGAYTKMQVAAAAQAGAEYAIYLQNKGLSFDSAKIANAVSGATALGATISPPSGQPASQSCGCLVGPTIQLFGTAPPCNQNCASGSVGVYVSVTAQTQFTPLFNYPLLPSPVTLSAQTTVRVN